MHLPTSLFALAFLALSTNAQTPSNYPPSTNNPLSVLYYDSHPIQPNELISSNLTLDAPTISLPRRHRNRHPHERYMILMLDISLSLCNDPSLASPSDASGLEANRTTYLHWFQGNLTRSWNDTLTACSEDSYAIAPYVPPSPNPGDIDHTYVFYLVRQPEDYVYEGKELDEVGRIGFDVRPIVEEAGGLVAGMYFRESGGSGEFC